jgi:hypothetical protein
VVNVSCAVGLLSIPFLLQRKAPGLKINMLSLRSQGQSHQISINGKPRPLYILCFFEPFEGENTPHETKITGKNVTRLPSVESLAADDEVATRL